MSKFRIIHLPTRSYVGVYLTESTLVPAFEASEFDSVEEANVQLTDDLDCGFLEGPRSDYEVVPVRDHEVSTSGEGY